MKWILTGSFLIFLLLNLNAEESELRPYRLINADTLRAIKINEEYVSYLIGNVNFFYGDTEFYADNAELYEKQKISRMTGNVKVFDDTLSLFADEAVYFRLEERLLLNNNVLVNEAHADSTIRTFKAEEVEYFRNLREFTALGNVEAYDEREQIRGYCGQLKYYIDDGYGYLLVNPEVILESRDSLALSAEKLEYFEDFQKIAANFNVQTISKEFTVMSDFLLYFAEEGKSIYLGEPQFVSEFAEATASEFRIFFIEDKISKAELIDFCKVYFKTEEQENKMNWVSADEMEFNFSEGKINSCNAYGNVDSYFKQEQTEDKDFSENSTRGEEMFLVIKDNEIEKIIMKNKVQGKYKFNQ